MIKLESGPFRVLSIRGCTASGDSVSKGLAEIATIFPFRAALVRLSRRPARGLNRSPTLLSSKAAIRLDRWR